MPLHPITVVDQVIEEYHDYHKLQAWSRAEAVWKVDLLPVFALCLIDET
jgi:hypothetical protein